MKSTTLYHYLIGFGTGAVVMLIFVILTERKLDAGSQAARAQAAQIQPTTQR